MSTRSLALSPKFEAQRRRASALLKSCPLCSALNSADNGECFVCSWSGQFDQNAEVIQMGLERLISRCPELAEAMLQEPKKSPSLLQRALSRFQRVFRVRLDLRV